MKLEAGIAYVFKDEESKKKYLSNKSSINNRHFRRYYNGSFIFDIISSENSGLINGDFVVVGKEVNFFKRKESFTKMKLEVGKTYIFKNEFCKDMYLNSSPRNKGRVTDYYRDGFKIENVSENGRNGGLEDKFSWLIIEDELQFFKEKEEEEKPVIVGKHLQDLLDKKREISLRIHNLISELYDEQLSFHTVNLDIIAEINKIKSVISGK